MALQLAAVLFMVKYSYNFHTNHIAIVPYISYHNVLYKIGYCKPLYSVYDTRYDIWGTIAI